MKVYIFVIYFTFTIEQKRFIMKKILLFTLITIAAISCNKNQKAVKRLSGTWRANKILVTNGNTATDLTTLGVTATFKFEKCKLKNDEYCEFTLTTTETAGSLTETFEETGYYKVTDDGATMIQTDALTNGTTKTFNIIELTKKKATLSNKIEDSQIDYELTKIN